MSNNPKNHITFAEACAKLNIARQTGYNQISRGVFPLKVRKIGRTSYVLNSAVDKFLTAQERVNAKAQKNLQKTQAAKKGRRRPAVRAS